MYAALELDDSPVTEITLPGRKVFSSGRRRHSTDDRDAGANGALRRFAECAVISAASLCIGNESRQRIFGGDGKYLSQRRPVCDG